MTTHQRAEVPGNGAAGPHRNLDLIRLERFLAFARLEHLGRAAQQLGLSASSLSDQLRALEADLGVRLTEKTGRGIRLTEPGRLLAVEGQSLLADAESLRQRLVRAAGGLYGTVRVGIPDGYSPVLARVVAEYREQRPGVVVTSLVAPGSNLQTALLEGALDLAVFGAERLGHPLVGEPCRRLSLAAFVDREHPLAAEDHLTPAHLRDVPLMIHPASSAHRMMFDAAMRSAGVSPVILLQSSSALTLLDWASCGLGVAMVPVLDYDNYLSDAPSNLVRRELLVDGQPLGIQMAIAWQDQVSLSPAAREVKDLMIATDMA